MPKEGTQRIKQESAYQQARQHWQRELVKQVLENIEKISINERVDLIMDIFSL